MGGGRDGGGKNKQGYVRTEHMSNPEYRPNIQCSLFMFQLLYYFNRMKKVQKTKITPIKKFSKKTFKQSIKKQEEGGDNYLY